MSAARATGVLGEAAGGAIEAFLSSHDAVSALPENSTRIIRMTSERDANTTVLLKLISQDAAVAGRIMKAVNSAFYALPNKVTRLDRAVALMGMKAVKEVTLSATLAGMCKGVTFGKYDDKDLWDHCVGVAILARELAVQSKRLDPEEMFLAGMLHDIGLLMLAQSETSKTAGVFSAAEAKDQYLPTEKLAFEFDHTQLGERMAKKWEFPEVTTTAIRFHHAPADAPQTYRLACQHLYIADTLCCLAERGFPLTCKGQSVTDEQLADAGLDREAADATTAKLPMLIRLFMS